METAYCEKCNYVKFLKSLSQVLYSGIPMEIISLWTDSVLAQKVYLISFCLIGRRPLYSKVIFKYARVNSLYGDITMEKCDELVNNDIINRILIFRSNL